MKVAVTRRLFERQVDRLREKYELAVWDSDIPPSTGELATLLQGVDGALTLLTDKIDRELLDDMPSLKVVSNLAVGFDNIDIEAATKYRVAVCTTPDVLTDSTAEFTLALLFAASRRIIEGDLAARSGDWKTWYPMRFLGIDLRGETFGIIGMGRIGQRVAELVEGIGMNAIYYDPVVSDSRFQQCELDDLLSASQVVSLHAPLNALTHHLLDRDRIALMRDDAILINTARGRLIETEALVEALEQNRLQSVALDVTDPEPLPAGHPLYAFDNVIITPHIASATVTTRTEMARLAVDNLMAVLEGHDPPHCLNPEVLDGE